MDAMSSVSTYYNHLLIITVCPSLPRLLYCPQIRAGNGGFLGTAHLPQDSNDGNITVCFFWGSQLKSYWCDGVMKKIVWSSMIDISGTSLQSKLGKMSEMLCSN